MGLCFSKKQHAKRREEQSKRSGGRNEAVAVEAKKTPSPRRR
jgi:hypothetical protein